MRQIIICFFLLIVCTVCSRSQEPPLLDRAINRQNYQLVEKLLNEGANPNERDQFGSSPLEWAVDKDDTLMINILLNHGADIQSRCPTLGGSLIGHCVSINRFIAAKYLIEHGLSVDLPDSSGITPLIQSIFLGNIQMIFFLLNNGANPNFIAPHNITPLWFALSESHRMNTLKQKDIEIEQHDTTGDTRRANDLQIIQILLKFGATPNPSIHYENGDTFLHQAAKQCDTSAAHLLVEYGANKNVKDDAGDRPYDLAVKNGCKGLEAILK